MRNKFLLVSLVCSFFCEAQVLDREKLGLKPPSTQNCTVVKDQYMSSTCWSFSSNSFLESELIKKGKGRLDLSEMFIARYSMVRKIERHLQLKGQNYFTPGGQFHDVIWVIKNYGMVPEQAYPGKARGEANHDHSELDTLLSQFVTTWVNSGITKLNNKQKFSVDSLLDHYLGVVPASFKVGDKMYTPRSYADQYLGIKANDYVEITSYTHHPFYKLFVLEDKYNWTGDAYYNVTIDEFSAITDNALAKGFTVGWDGDADDPGFNFYSGLAYLYVPNEDFQGERQAAFENQATLLNHMMHITGSTNDKYGKKWYYIKTSWGSSTNSLGGFLFMREDYFKIRTVAIIVNKAAIPTETRKKLGL
jgi:bleomycin hydrolase